jgi:hypothetical protein
MNICFNRRGVVPLVAPRRPLAVVDRSLASFSKTKSIHPSVYLSKSSVVSTMHDTVLFFLPWLGLSTRACTDALSTQKVSPSSMGWLPLLACKSSPSCMRHNGTEWEQFPRTGSVHTAHRQTYGIASGASFHQSPPLHGFHHTATNSLCLSLRF